MKITILRIIHGVAALYFIACLIYLYYAAITSTFDLFLLIAMISLGIEWIVVYIFNGGDCPLIHVQRIIGDDIPFFELFLPSAAAKKALPVFVGITWGGVALLIISAYINAL